MDGKSFVIVCVKKNIIDEGDCYIRYGVLSLPSQTKPKRPIDKLKKEEEKDRRYIN